MIFLPWIGQNPFALKNWNSQLNLFTLRFHNCWELRKELTNRKQVKFWNKTSTKTNKKLRKSKKSGIDIREPDEASQKMKLVKIRRIRILSIRTPYKATFRLNILVEISSPYSGQAHCYTNGLMEKSCSCHGLQNSTLNKYKAIDNKNVVSDDSKELKLVRSILISPPRRLLLGSVAI